MRKRPARRKLSKLLAGVRREAERAASHEVIEVKVSRVHGTWRVVDLGGKTEGLIPAADSRTRRFRGRANSTIEVQRRRAQGRLHDPVRT